MKTFSLVAIITVMFSGCGQPDNEIISDFNSGKQLNCTLSASWLPSRIISNKTWQYSKNLNIFFNETTSDSYRIESCSSK